MSRTSSQTLPYWQFEVGLFDDGKFVELSDKYGPLGEAVFNRIMCYITQSDGYFAQLNDALILYIYRSVGNKWVKSKRLVSEVIQFCGVCGLFDVNLLSQNVITSQGIQRRWLYAKKKSRAQGFSTAKYWLLNDEPLHGREHNNSDNCNNNSDNCNNNSDNCNNNSDIKVSKGNIPPISPQKGAEEDKDKEAFFKVFPKLAKCRNYNDSGIDYKKLLRAFNSSERLKNTYSMRWVCDNYEAIISGEMFGEKNSNEFDKAAWERWNSNRRYSAEELAENKLAQATSDSHYGKIYRELNALYIRLAFAEIKDANEALQLKERIKELELKGEERLKELGIDKSDFSPKYSCKECKNTGYNEKGYICDRCLKMFRERWNIKDG